MDDKLLVQQAWDEVQAEEEEEEQAVGKQPADGRVAVEQPERGRGAMGWEGEQRSNGNAAGCVRASAAEERSADADAQAQSLGEEKMSAQPLLVALRAEADTQALQLLVHDPLVVQLLVLDSMPPASIHVMGHSNKEWRVANALRESVMCKRILALCRGELSAVGHASESLQLSGGHTCGPCGRS